MGTYYGYDDIFNYFVWSAKFAYLLIISLRGSFQRLSSFDASIIRLLYYYSADTFYYYFYISFFYSLFYYFIFLFFFSFFFYSSFYFY